MSEPQDSDEPQERNESPARAAGGPGPLGTARGRLIAVVLAALVVGLGVWATVLGLDVRAGESKAQRQDAIRQAARQEAVNLVSIDYRNAQKDIDRVLSGTTGEARDQWAQLSKQFVSQVAQAQATSIVQSDPKVGIVAMDDDSAEVIVAVSSVVSSPKVQQGTPRNFRFSMNLARTDGRWLVSKLGLVP
jgi:Mce-associated membrane protein